MWGDLIKKKNDDTEELKVSVNPNNIDNQVVRNLAIEIGSENIELKEVVAKQAETIQSLQEKLAQREQMLELCNKQYDDICVKFETIRKAYDKKIEELREYSAKYQDLIKEMQVRRAKTNRIINDLEKSLLRQSKTIKKDLHYINEDKENEAKDKS